MLRSHLRQSMPFRDATRLTVCGLGIVTRLLLATTEFDDAAHYVQPDLCALRPERGMTAAIGFRRVSHTSGTHMPAHTMF